MNSKRIRTVGACVVSALIGLAVGVAPAVADRDEYRNGYGDSDDRANLVGGRVEAVSLKSSKGGFDPIYVEECGSCHVPYPPAALPARSWKKLMVGLADHFGDNAELDAETQARVGTYLESLSTGWRRGAAAELAEHTPRDETPLRITELRHFKKEHNKIPSRFFSQNPTFKLSQCDACHTKAAQNSFRERDINIPGIGPWED